MHNGMSWVSWCNTQSIGLTEIDRYNNYVFKRDYCKIKNSSGWQNVQIIILDILLAKIFNSQFSSALAVIRLLIESINEIYLELIKDTHCLDAAT